MKNATRKNGKNGEWQRIMINIDELAEEWYAKYDPAFYPDKDDDPVSDYRDCDEYEEFKEFREWEETK